MTAQLSPLRTGRVTASRVGAILGLSPYNTRDDVLREMVRDHFGDEPEFTGNWATRRGQEVEEPARADYERLCGTLVLDAQEFIKHPDYDWIGCSPDGLVGADGMVEIKYWPVSRPPTLRETPHYHAQVQTLLACLDRAWCDVVMWREGLPIAIERSERDREWFDQNLPTLKAFHDEYLAVIGDLERAAPFRTSKIRTDQDWLHAEAEYLAADAAVAAAEASRDDWRARLLELAGERSQRGPRVSVNRAVRAGTVDYKKLAAKHAPDVDPEEFRKPSSVVWTVRPVKVDES